MGEYVRHGVLLVIGIPAVLVVMWRWRRAMLRRGLAVRRRNGRMIAGGAGLLCLVGAAADIRLPERRVAPEVVFLADVSAGVSLAAQQLRLRKLAAAIPPETEMRAALTVFARRPLLVSPLQKLSVFGKDERPTLLPPRVKFQRLRTSADPSATDIAAALRFACGLFAGGLSKGDDSGGAAVRNLEAGERAVVLLSDCRDTWGKAAPAAAAELKAGGVALLVRPSALGATGDFRVAAVQVPAAARVGRALSVAVTVAAERPCRLSVRLVPTDRGSVLPPKTVELGRDGVFRRTVRFTDRPERPGVIVYEAQVRAAAAAGDFRRNNKLYAAVPVGGPSRWAILTRPGSTLAAWAAEVVRRPLGVKTKLFLYPALPTEADDFTDCTGVLVDGFSAAELPPDGAALQALGEAVRRGLGLIAVGGPRAFGVGGHPVGGTWEQLLPVSFRPDDDRVRTVLFLVDVSQSMNRPLPKGGLKLQFARAAVAQAIRQGQLGADVRLGLISFSKGARLCLAPTADREAFVRALVDKLRIERETDLRTALREAEKVLAGDDAEERILILLSDGNQTVGDTEAVEKELEEIVSRLCPPPASESGKQTRRTILHTFGIGAGKSAAEDQGTKLLRKLAKIGGGAFFEDILDLPDNLPKAWSTPPKDLYARRDEYAVKVSSPHPLLSAVLEPSAPLSLRLHFRNRVKARPAADVLLKSAPTSAPSPPGGSAHVRRRRVGPDPLFVTGYVGAGRARAVLLAFGLDGRTGREFLKPQASWRGGRRLLAAAAAWAERRDGGVPPGWRIETEITGNDRLTVRVRLTNSAGIPINGEHLALHVGTVGGPVAAERKGRAGKVAEGGAECPLRQTAPGEYEADIPAASAGVYRLEISRRGRPTAERFVAVPYPREYSAFGVDYAAADELVRRAGGRSRILSSADDFTAWLRHCTSGRGVRSLRQELLAAALLFFSVAFLLPVTASLRRR